MPRSTWAIVVSVVLVLIVLALVGQRAGFWGSPDPGSPPSTATADRPGPPAERGSVQPPSASALPPERIDRAGGEMNPVPSGTPDVRDRTTPPSATPRAPSGEPALLDQAPPARR